MMIDNFYRAFEDRYRGSRELIKSRLHVYLPFVQPLLKAYPAGKVLDLGCGRGEWLELMGEQGFDALGVDLNDGMLQACRERNLKVETVDAVAYMKGLPRSSLCVVSGFHIAEHIVHEQLQQLVQQAERVLVPGGLLILETPNPENLIVGTCSFYLDPSHLSPIPPALLHFLSEYYGYARQKIIRLQEAPELAKSLNISLFDVVGGVSPDYSVIAQTKAPAEVLQAFDVPFSQNYGLSLHTLAERFQQNMSNQLDLAESAAQAQLQQALQVAQTAQEQMQHALAKSEQIEAKAQEVEAKAEQAKAKAEQAKAKAEQAEAKAEQAEAKAEQAEAKAEQAEAKAEQAEAKAEQAEAKAQLAEAKAEQAEAKAELAEAKVLEAQVQTSSQIQTIQDKDAELAAVRQELNNVHQANHYHWQLAEQRQLKIDALHSSTSWSITAPLRWPVQQVRLLRQHGLKPRVKALAKKLLKKLILLVIVRPTLRSFATRLAHRFGVADRLKPLARTLLATSSPAIENTAANQPISVPSSDLAKLPPRARQIYADLKAAIAQQHKGGH